MRRLAAAFFAITSVVFLLSGCEHVNPFTPTIVVSVSNTFATVEAGGAPVTLKATVNDDPHFQGVTWSLTLAGAGCAPGCGTIRATDAFTAIYTPPQTTPTNQTATITATAIDNHRSVYVFNFEILPLITVTITNKFASIKSGEPALVLNVQVAYDPANAGVTWTLTAGGTNCSPACGTLTAPAAPAFTATYTPPVTPPTGSNASPTITATSVTENTQNDNFTFNILPGILVQIVNKFMTQTVDGGSVIVNASVSNDSSNAGVSWALTAGGTNCSPACGTLVVPAAPTFSATYTPPTTAPSGANVSPTITATSIADPTKSDSFNFTITVAVTVFQGSYAILMRGFDVTGSPVVIAGSITSDGNSNITGGELDINNNGGITNIPSPMTGNYTLDSSFNGVIRGTVNITSYTFPSGTNLISFRFVLSSDASRGKILEIDGLGFLVVGTIRRQDPGSLSAANPQGSYAFGLDSDAPLGGRTVSAGQLVLGNAGVTGGLIDESEAQNLSLPRYAGAAITAGNLTAPDSSGRGTLTMNVDPSNTPSSGPASSRQYAYYIVKSGPLDGQLILIEIDQGLTFGTAQAGVARAQNLPFTANSIVTTSVMQLTGMDVSPTTQAIGPETIVGVMGISTPINSAPNSILLTWDENDIGTVYTSRQIAGSVSSFDPATGRGVLSISGGFSAGFVESAVLYLNDAGTGFIIDADVSTCLPGGPISLCPGGHPPNNYPITNNALSGTLTPQASGPFGSQSLAGNLLFSYGPSATTNLPVITAAINLGTSNDPNNVPYTGIADLASLPSQAGNDPGAGFSGLYSYPDASGHGAFRLPQQLFGTFGSIANDLTFFYMIGPNQGAGIEVCFTGACPSSGIYTFDPQ